MFPFRIFTLVVLMAATASRASANEQLAFKSFVLGGDAKSIQRNPGITCVKPSAIVIPKSVTGPARTLANRYAKLEAVENGDLVCTSRSETIAGQRVDKVTLRIFSGKLLQLEMALKYQAPPRIRGTPYPHPPAQEIDDVSDALTKRYGAPTERKQTNWDCICAFVHSEWTMKSGDAIAMERRVDSASAAKVTYTAAAYEKVRGERRVATLAAHSDFVELNSRNIEHAKKKNLQDL